MILSVIGWREEIIAVCGKTEGVAHLAAGIAHTKSTAHLRGSAAHLSIELENDSSHPNSLQIPQLASHKVCKASHIV